MDAPLNVGMPTRRLGHANLFVRAGGLDASSVFYNQIVGLEEVRREPAIKVSLLTVGRTHHDIGLIEASGEERRGVDNYVQVPKGRGATHGLNHLGWETRSEAALAAAYHRAIAAGISIHRTADHQSVHSAYIFDPDGNLNEWYADVVERWEALLNPSREDLIRKHWNIGGAAVTSEARYPRDPPIRRVEEAVFHTKGLTSVTLLTRDIDRMVAYYREFGGLTPDSPEAGGALCRLRGACGQVDLNLIRAKDSTKPGLHHVTLEMPSEEELNESLRCLGDRGISRIRVVDNHRKKSVFVLDPNELLLEFRCTRSDVRDDLGDITSGVDMLAYLA